MTAFNRSNMDPDRREHFVYRVFDADDRLLYVGCSMRPSLRYQEHRGQSKWFPLAAHFKMQGPFNYDTGRRLEREAIRTESPLWNHDEPKRFRLRAIRLRISNRWFKLEHELQGHPNNWLSAHEASMAHLNKILPTSAEHGRYVSHAEVDEAEEADWMDRIEFRNRVRQLREAEGETA